MLRCTWRRVRRGRAPALRRRVAAPDMAPGKLAQGRPGRAGGAASARASTGTATERDAFLH